MNFECIPDHLFLEIFRLLPLRDQVRAGRVNTTFRRMSKIAVSETKALDFSEEPRRFTTFSVRTLVRLCANNLEEITFGWSDRDHSRRLLNEFAGRRHRCPNLRKFNCWCAVATATLRRILENNPNLESLGFFGVSVIFPAGIVCDRLESLNCAWFDNCEMFESMTGKIPNLKQFQLVYDRYGFATTIVSPQTLDRFLASVRKLESVIIEASEDMQINRINSFWQLRSLRNLELLPCRDGQSAQLWIVDDTTLTKIADAFPRLSEIMLCDIKFTATYRGISALSNLKDLECLCLAPIRRVGEPPSTTMMADDFTLRRMSACKRLRLLHVGGLRISSKTVIALLIDCPALCCIGFADFGDIDTIDRAVSFLRHVRRGRLAETKAAMRIKIMFETETETNVSIWKSDAVKMALKELKDEDNVNIIVCWDQF